MKTLKEYAIDHGIKYRAAWNRYKAGKIPSAFQDEFGKILIKEDIPGDFFCGSSIWITQKQKKNRTIDQEFIQ